MPPADQVRDRLERILASETFARSGRSRDFLRYLVERQLAGEAGRLKGFAIAVDVFGRDAGFDPATDAVVRVQAGRLRELLSQYYASEGRDDTIRISIPRGGYAPAYAVSGELPAALPPFSSSSQPPAAGAAVPPRGRGPRRARRLLGAVAAMLVVALSGYFGYAIFATDGRPVGTIPGAAGNPGGNLDLPAVHVRMGDEAGETRRVAAVLRKAVTGFDTVDFLSHRQYDGKPSEMEDDHFVFQVGELAGHSATVVEIVHARSGKVLLSRAIGHGSDERALQNAVADMLTAVLPVSGVIYAHVAENGPPNGLARCLLLNDRYYRNQQADRHRAAYECLDTLDREGYRSPLIQAELAALTLEAVTDRYPHPPGATVDAAMALAREAVQDGPASPYAHRAYGYVLSRTGNRDEAVRWMRKAYDLNVFDLGMAASYAYTLIFAGRYELGAPLMAHAVETASAHATWWDYGLFLGYFMLDDMVSASRAASALTSGDRVHYLAARAIVAHADGLVAQRDELLARLTAANAVFVADPEGYFRRANYPDEMAARLVRALREAGLSSAS